VAFEEQAVEGSLADARRAGDDDGAGVGRSWFGVSRVIETPDFLEVREYFFGGNAYE
jgi:hypothetical protein